MTKKQRIEYLTVTSAAFVSGALLYSAIAWFAQTNDPNFPPFLLFGALAGLLIGGISCGIIFAARFFSRKSTVFKTVAAFLWFITLICVVYGGVFCFLPYGIYNLVKIAAAPKTHS